ncbi:hypothetical protein [Streptomyces sp. NPDC058667]|uniref:Imm32 family immunity protein n=1 Tax=Streptomyces sp. NPDC058667 TaxID=3346588 RepID=UPI003665BA86
MVPPVLMNMANAAGLRTLAGHLLLLAGDGFPEGAHLHLEDSNGLEDGSVGLVPERSDDERLPPAAVVKLVEKLRSTADINSGG